MFSSLFANGDLVFRFFCYVRSTISFEFVGWELFCVFTGHAYTRYDAYFIGGPRGKAALLLFAWDFTRLRVSAYEAIGRRVFSYSVQYSVYRIKGQVLLYLGWVSRGYSNASGSAIVVDGSGPYGVLCFRVLGRLVFTSDVVGVPKVREVGHSPGLISRHVRVRATRVRHFITSSLEQARFVGLVRGAATIQGFYSGVVPNKGVYSHGTMTIYGVSSARSMVVLHFVWYLYVRVHSKYGGSCGLALCSPLHDL